LGYLKEQVSSISDHTTTAMPQKPISTVRIPEDGKPDITLEILREPEDFHNRYAQNSATKVTPH